MQWIYIQYTEIFIAWLRVFNLEFQRSHSFQRILNLGHWDWPQIVPHQLYALGMNECVHTCACRGNLARISAHWYACMQSLNACLHHGYPHKPAIKTSTNLSKGNHSKNAGVSRECSPVCAPASAVYIHACMHACTTYASYTRTACVYTQYLCKIYTFFSCLQCPAHIRIYIYIHIHTNTGVWKIS